MTIQTRIENLESITRDQVALTRDQIAAGKGVLKVLDGLQKQIEGLIRLSQLDCHMIQLLAGVQPEESRCAAVQELSDQAKREIEELRRLYEADGGGKPEAGDQ